MTTHLLAVVLPAVATAAALRLPCTAPRAPPCRCRLDSAPGVENTIREAIAADTVVVFSKSSCPYCLRTKELFNQLNVPAAVVELDQRDDGAAIQQELLRMTGQRTVPNVWVGGEHVGGNDDTEAWYSSGRLQAKLGGAEIAGTAEPVGVLRRRRVNVALAIGSPLLASALFFAQRSSLLRVDPVVLLQRMEAQSPTLPAALANGRATVVEFYAPWCESCKVSAPSMFRLQKAYAERLNFVVINGNDARNADLVQRFGVDGIPHLALISGQRKLVGTLIGGVPEGVLEQNLRALAEGEPLPFARTNLQ